MVEHRYSTFVLIACLLRVKYDSICAFRWWYNHSLIARMLAHLFCLCFCSCNKDVSPRFGLIYYIQLVCMNLCRIRCICTTGSSIWGIATSKEVWTSFLAIALPSWSIVISTANLMVLLQLKAGKHRQRPQDIYSWGLWCVIILPLSLT